MGHSLSCCKKRSNSEAQPEQVNIELAGVGNPFAAEAAEEKQKPLEIIPPVQIIRPDSKEISVLGNPFLEPNIASADEEEKDESNSPILEAAISPKNKIIEILQFLARNKRTIYQSKIEDNHCHANLYAMRKKLDISIINEELRRQEFNAEMYSNTNYLQLFAEAEVALHDYLSTINKAPLRECLYKIIQAKYKDFLKVNYQFCPPKAEHSNLLVELINTGKEVEIIENLTLSPSPLSELPRLALNEARAAKFAAITAMQIANNLPEYHDQETVKIAAATWIHAQVEFETNKNRILLEQVQKQAITRAAQKYFRNRALTIVDLAKNAVLIAEEAALQAGQIAAEAIEEIEKPTAQLIKIINEACAALLRARNAASMAFEYAFRTAISSQNTSAQEEFLCGVPDWSSDQAILSTINQYRLVADMEEIKDLKILEKLDVNLLPDPRKGITPHRSQEIGAASASSDLSIQEKPGPVCMTLSQWLEPLPEINNLDSSSALTDSEWQIIAAVDARAAEIDESFISPRFFKSKPKWSSNPFASEMVSPKNN